MKIEDLYLVTGNPRTPRESIRMMHYAESGTVLIVASDPLAQSDFSMRLSEGQVEQLASWVLKIKTDRHCYPAHP